MIGFAAMGSALSGALGTIQYTYNTSGTAGTVSTLPTYNTQATQGTATPYIIYQLQDSLGQYVFGNKSGESADYVVKVVSNKLTPSAQAYAIYDHLHEVLQDASLTIVGAYPLRVRQISRIEYQDTQKFWHVGGIFRIDAWNT